MRVKNHKDFCCFKYKSTTDEFTLYSLGDIVIREVEDEPEIGVVIQLYDRGDLRTDMFGNCYNDEVRLATKKEIEQYRIDLIKHLKK